MRNRLTPEQRMNEIVNAAVRDALKRGLYKISLATIAKEAEVSKSLVKTYYGTITNMRRIVINQVRENLNDANAVILVQAKSNGDL